MKEQNIPEVSLKNIKSLLSKQNMEIGWSIAWRSGLLCLGIFILFLFPPCEFPQSGLLPPARQ